MQRVFWAGLIPLLVGCSPQISVDDSAALFGENGESPRVGRFLWVQETRTWNREIPCGRSPCRERRFEIEIGATKEFERVGVVWSDDRGASWATTQARREELGPGFRRWTVSTFSRRPDNDVEFRIFADLSGERSWESSRLRHVARGATATSPVRIQEIRLSEAGESSARIGMRVEVFRFEADGHLGVTVGGDAPLECVRAGDESWDCEGILSFPFLVPDEIEVLATYDVGDAGFVDRRTTRVKPEGHIGLVPGAIQDVGAQGPLSGTLIFQCSFEGSVSSTSMRVDGGAWSSGDRLIVETGDLSDGRHRVECLGNEGMGPLEGRSSYFFEVKNPWSELERAALPAMLEAGLRRLSGVLSWDEEGRALAVFGKWEGERHLIRWNPRMNSAEARYALPSATTLTVTAASGPRVVGLDAESGLVRIWERPENEGRTVAIPSRFLLGRNALALSGDAIFLASSGTRELAAISLETGRTTFRPLDEGDTCRGGVSVGIAAAFDSGLVWTTCGNLVRGYVVDGEKLVERARVTLSQAVREPVALTRDGQGRFWIADATPSRVVVFEADGTFSTAWYATGRKAGFSGDFGIPSALTLDMFGDLLLGTAFDAETLRFRSALP